MGKEYILSKKKTIAVLTSSQAGVGIARGH
jgi:hypothetical protein